ncbi:hypothetical protein GDO81_002646 [Engystomops pustulosus]|uniref:Transmembrane protein 174 n=1 Tax=Engystomops pustulosus TaxID=76066 RepID=A0AAV7DLX4_ENGPU|nr:hypothetical protein GDO81_002646 [Engystomops pustulosus]
MEQNSPQVDDFSISVFSLPPYPNSQPEVRVSDRNKASATLLFSGLFLGLVGITFTVMGWIKHEESQGIGWTKMIGPVLLLVGITFILICFCKFKAPPCKLCKKSNDTTVDPEQLSSGQSFVFTGINQPITFHGATVVQYIPPPYTVHDDIARSPNASSVLSGAGIMNGIDLPILPPQYSTIYPQENPAFVDDEDSSQSPDHARSPAPGHEHIPVAQRHSGPPPLYEDLYPHLK